MSKLKFILKRLSILIVTALLITACATGQNQPHPPSHAEQQVGDIVEALVVWTMGGAIIAGIASGDLWK